MAAPQNPTEWQLHLDRRSNRCVLRRAGQELPLIGGYSLDEPDHPTQSQILRLRFPASAVTARDISNPHPGAV
jgi:hypothetical protein